MIYNFSGPKINFPSKIRIAPLSNEALKKMALNMGDIAKLETDRMYSIYRAGKGRKVSKLKQNVKIALIAASIVGAIGAITAFVTSKMKNKKEK